MAVMKRGGVYLYRFNFYKNEFYKYLFADKLFFLTSTSVTFWVIYSIYTAFLFISNIKLKYVMSRSHLKKLITFPSL